MRAITDSAVDWEVWETLEDAQKVCKPSDYMDEILSEIRGDVSFSGDPLPWNKPNSTDRNFRLRPSEVTLWAGQNHSGKSEILSMVVGWLLPFTNVMLASMEMPIRKTMKRMVSQVAGVRNPSLDFARKFTRFTDDRLWMYDHRGLIDPMRLIAASNYAAHMLNVKHIVVDSLMTFDMNSDDYNRQKRIIANLCAMAKDLNIHVHLVVHSRKPEKHKAWNLGDRFDISGSGDISNQVDNVAILFRNKPKEDANELRLMRGEEVDDNEPDSILRIDKQRHGDWTGNYAFWHSPCGQYCESSQRRIVPWHFPDEQIAVVS